MVIMSREVKRVALDFDWPLREVWQGYLMPDSLDGLPCSACDSRGWSPRAGELHDLWYGNRPFRPEDNGSIRLTSDAPAVRAFAENNVAQAPEFYGSSEYDIRREAIRLAALWNSMWCHHLNDDDVAALIAADRLMDFTHEFIPGEGWKKLDHPVIPTAAKVNEWSLRGFGHDSINAYAVIKDRCAREGEPLACPVCDGHGSIEAYPGQRAESDAWTPTEPPTGGGWQLWETVSEGSPISPVFPTDEALAGWLTTEEGGRAVGTRRHPVSLTLEQACGLVRAGWAPTGIGNAGGYHDGAEFIATEAAVGDLFND
jgi:hypothetical protein